MFPDNDAGRHEREHTDESLRVERDKVDSALAEKRSGLVEAADEVVRVARDQADAIVKAARQENDRSAATAPPSSEVRAESEHQRSLDDAALQRKRAAADAQLQEEREQRNRTMDDFLAVERDQTDEHLIGERVRADVAIAARDEFLGMVSHDLRGLLQALALNASAYARTAPEDEAGARMRRHTQSTQRFVARMNRLINDLLDVTSIEAGRLTIEPEQQQVPRLVHEAVESFQPIAAAKGVTLDAEGLVDPLSAEFDHDRILQVLANLLSNAIKFTPEHGRIVMRAEPVGDDIRFAVTDSGIGIPEEHLEAIFERFRQVSRHDRRGLGLGLYISKCIVEAHGGRMWAASTLGAGSTLYFTVPIAQPPKPQAVT